MKAMAYGTFETLRQKNAVLRETVKLNSGIQLAAWYNNLDTITVQSDHHTLSLYIADGYESYQKTPHGWKNGGGPDRFCLMPKGDESTWDIRELIDPATNKPVVKVVRKGEGTALANESTPMTFDTLKQVIDDMAIDAVKFDPTQK